MRGFTFFEFLISIAIISVISVLVVSGLSSFRESAQLSEAQSQILGVLRDARSRTLSSEKNTQYGVRFETSQIVLFSGSLYNAGSASNEPHLLPPIARVSSISLGGPVDIVFARVTGSASASGTITVESISNAAKTKTITILSSGATE
ncbi:MAG: prepilin-type N-terminal cleavage/methylation domain-containing protein [Patescibacteria group bacterium]